MSRAALDACDRKQLPFSPHLQMNARGSGRDTIGTAAASIAAAATVMLRLPFTSALLAVLILGSAGMAIAPFAIIGAVVGFGMRQALDKFDARRAAAAEPATA